MEKRTASLQSKTKKSVLLSLLCCIGLTVAATISRADDVLPLCGVVADPPTWNALDGSSQVSGNIQQVDTDCVTKALIYNCACQLRMKQKLIIFPDNGGSAPGDDGLTSLPLTSASPNSFDAKNGDGQPLTITMNSPAFSVWRGCFPGRAASPSSLCPESVFSQPADNGVMLFRLRQNDGTFSGQWTVTNGDISPGFAIRQTGSCPFQAVNCPYEIVFSRDQKGEPTVKRDAQVLLQTHLQLPAGVTELGGAYSSDIVIPLFVKQAGSSGGVSPTPTPTPSSNPSVCVVPKTAGKTVAKAKKLLNSKGCQLGKVTKKKTSKIGKDKVISSRPAAGKVIASGSTVNLTVSKGR